MRLYRLLLRLYPAWFRAEYAEEMCTVFAARRSQENVLALWSSTIFDVIINAIRVQADVLRQDLNWTLRTLRQSPGFTLTAVSVIALGIGANTSAFTLLDHALLRPLPYAQPEQLVMLYQNVRGTSRTRLELSPPNYLDWRTMSKSFQVMGASGGSAAGINLSGQGEPQRLTFSMLNSDTLKALGVEPAFGRGFSAEDDRFGAPDVVLLSHNLASTLYGSPADAVGRTINLDNRPRAIIGVMPPEFGFPSPDRALWLPLRFTPGSQDRTNYVLGAVARLRPGVSIDEARVELDVITKQLELAYPKDNAGMGATVMRMRDTISPASRVLVLTVFGAAFCVLLIACTNLANLLLARAMVRSQEIAVRVAIGAARERLLRQLLTESLALAIAGGTLGLLLAAGVMPLLASLVPGALPVSGIPQLDLRVFAFAAVLTILTSIVFGVGPALRSCRKVDLNALRSRSTTGGKVDRLRGTLVLAEVAGTVILLVGTGLLLKAMWRVQATDPGFRADGALTLRTTLPMPKYSATATRQAFYSRVLTEARALPGVTSAAYTSFLPLTFGAGIFSATLPGLPEEYGVGVRYVTPDFFQALGIPLLRGRDISGRDNATAPLSTVISQSLARRLWPEQDAIGQQLNVGGASWTVIGIVGDVMVRGLERFSEPQVYFPSEQQVGRGFYAPKDLVVRASGDVTALAPALRRIIHDVDPEQAVSDVRPLEEIVTQQTGTRRDQLQVLGAFATVAFLLAAVGIHGLLSFAVTSRTREVGVRMALGAARGDILAMFLRQGVVLGAAGVAVAIPLAYLAARGMTSLLFGVEPSDPLIYAAAAALALLMTIAGSLRPALRAASIDPVITIRTE